VGLLGRVDVRPCANLDQGNPQPVEAVANPAVGLGDALGALLLEHEVLDADRALLGLDDTVGGDKHGPLEAGRVRAVDDEFAHDVGPVDRLHIEQLRNLECRREGLAVDAPGRFVVLLDQTGRVVGEILELPVDATLLERGRVEFAQLAFRRMQVPGEAPLGRLRVTQRRGTVTEQLRLRVELLVDLQPRHEPELLVVVLTHWWPLRYRAQKTCRSRRECQSEVPL